MIAGSKAFPDTGTKGPMKQYRELFPSLLTITLLAVFGSSFMSGIRLCLDVNARYWIGVWGYTVILIPLLIIGAHVAQAYFRKPLFFAVLASCAIPPLIAVVVGWVYLVPVNHIVSRLDSTDCTTFRQKQHIEQAYKAAQQLFDHCVSDEAKNKSKTEEVIRAEIVITDCKDYKPQEHGYPSEWSYLKHLEENQNCAGWCRDGEPALWTHNPEKWDSCSAAAAADMKEKVARNSLRMMVNGIIGFVVSAVIIVVVNEWINRSGDQDLHW